MSLASDLRILWALAVGGRGGANHAERLEAFYGRQAGDYDDFRRRLLHGREEMLAALALPAGGTLLDLGGGTGSNLVALGERRAQLQRITLVDLAPSLLRVADQRIRDQGWDNVETVAADATTFAPPAGPVDGVTFSYALTMIPDWFKAIERAYDNLKPGGLIGVVDFYVARKWPDAALRRQSWWRRTFWPIWFGWDNVYPSPDHLPFLRGKFETVLLKEAAGKVPYLLGLQAPYYIFVGRKT